VGVPGPVVRSPRGEALTSRLAPAAALVPRSGPKSLLLLTLCLAAVRLAAGSRSAGFLSDLNTGDPGQWLDSGDRILSGSWPFRDWIGIYGPLLYAWGAGWYRVLGGDWLAAGLMLEVVSPVACLLLAALVAHWSLPSPGWRLVFVAAVGCLGLDACYWSPALRLWVPLAGVAWTTSALRRGARGELALACAVCGICPFLSPETGLAAMAACVLAMAIAHRPPGCVGPGLPLPVALGCIAAPGLLAIGLMPHVTGAYVRDTAALAGSANWIWGVPFPGSAYPWRRALFLAPVALTAGGGLVALFRAIRRREDGAEDLVYVLFAASVYRTVLGRTDAPHLLFALPPVLVLWFRLISRIALSRGLVAGAVAVVTLAPYGNLSFAEGQLGRSARALLPRPGPTASLGGERVSAPAGFCARLERIVAAARPHAPAGRSVLSLPGPLYAHLLRRTNAMPVAIPELLGTGRAASAAALAALEADPPAVVIVDEAQCLPWDPQFVLPPAREPLTRRLTWSSYADEAIARDLRRWLAARYRAAGVIDGARILVARRPIAEPPARELAVLEPGALQQASLARGDLARFAVAGIACDEVRLKVSCRYPCGLAWLAKSYVRVQIYDQDGRIHGGVLPVPPASLDLELRVPVPRLALTRIDLEVGSPGSFNPAPVAVTVPAVRLIRYSGGR